MNSSINQFLNKCKQTKWRTHVQPNTCRHTVIFSQDIHVLNYLLIYIDVNNEITSSIVRTLIISYQCRRQSYYVCSFNGYTKVSSVCHSCCYSIVLYYHINAARSSFYSLSLFSVDKVVAYKWKSFSTTTLCSTCDCFMFDLICLWEYGWKHTIRWNSMGNVDDCQSYVHDGVSIDELKFKSSVNTLYRQTRTIEFDEWTDESITCMSHACRDLQNEGISVGNAVQLDVCNHSHPLHLIDKTNKDMVAYHLVQVFFCPVF
jgi:hypothetical protein